MIVVRRKTRFSRSEGGKCQTRVPRLLVNKNEVLDLPVCPMEGNIIVISIVEERVVVTKRLVLIEEIREA